MASLADIALTGLPPAWKTAAVQSLYSRGYVQSKPYAIGGGAEASFLLEHPAFLVYNDATKTQQYADWLIHQGFFKLTGAAAISGDIGQVMNGVTSTITKAPPYKLFTLAVVVIGAYFVYRKVSK